MVGRGRPKGSKNKTKAASPSSGASPGIGHNGLSEPEVRANAFRHKALIARAEKAKREATKAVSEAYKLADKEGVGKDTLADLRELEKPGGAALFEARMQRMLRSGRWSGFDVPEQGDFFATQRQPDVEKARALGEVAALNGEDCSPPYDIGSEQGQAWISGWHEGQSAMLSLLDKLKVSADRVAEAVPGTQTLIKANQSEPEAEPEVADEKAEEGDKDDASVDADVIEDTPEPAKPTASAYGEQWKAQNVPPTAPADDEWPEIPAHLDRRNKQPEPDF